MPHLSLDGGTCREQQFTAIFLLFYFLRVGTPLNIPQIEHGFGRADGKRGGDRPSKPSSVVMVSLQQSSTSRIAYPCLRKSSMTPSQALLFSSQVSGSNAVPDPCKLLSALAETAPRRVIF